MQPQKVMILSILFILLLVLFCLAVCMLLSFFIGLHKFVREKTSLKKTFKEIFFKLVAFMCDPLKNL